MLTRTLSGLAVFRQLFQRELLSIGIAIGIAICLVLGILPGSSSAANAFGQTPPGLSSCSPAPLRNATATVSANSPKGTPSVSTAGVSSDYRLGSGDHVRIVVFGQKDLTGKYLVDGAGTIAFPLIGQVRAGGLTASQLAREIASKLSPEYLRHPQVSAEVLTYRPFYILGEVKSPGSYPYVSGMTVINAVALAGGFTPRAEEDDFSLTRTGKEGERVKIEANQNTPVKPGDVIRVPERWF